MYGPCLSTIGGGQALTSPKRHSLGKPLPYQLADTPQANPQAINLYRTLFLILEGFKKQKECADHQVLAHLSVGYS